jgi:hypothetical protein
VELLQTCVAEELHGKSGQQHAAEYQARARAKAEQQVAPDLFFRGPQHQGKYSAYDERGVPTLDADGELTDARAGSCW